MDINQLIAIIKKKIKKPNLYWKY